MSEQTLQLLRDIVRVGNVVTTIPDKRAVRVQFPDMDDMVSHDLRMIFRRTSTDKDAGGLPDTGDQVVCIYLPNGDEEGFVIGSIYSDEDIPPPGGQEKVIHWVTKSGIEIIVDRETNAVSVTGAKTIAAQATESATVVAPVITLEGNVRVTGTLDVDGHSTLSGGARIAGIEFETHRHGGVESGGSSTGGPQ